MTDRQPFLPWFREIVAILGPSAPATERELDLMWRAGLTPVEAAAAIVIAAFERSLNA